jgi:hypothetical protein
VLTTVWQSGVLPGAKLKRFTAKTRNSSRDGDEDDARHEREILMAHVLAGTITTSQAWRHLTSSTPASQHAETSAKATHSHPVGEEQFTHDDGTPIMDPMAQASDDPQWIWVSPRDAAQDSVPSAGANARPYFEPRVARQLYRAGVGAGVGQGAATGHDDAHASSGNARNGGHPVEFQQALEAANVQDTGSLSTSLAVQDLNDRTVPRHGPSMGGSSMSIKQADTSWLQEVVAKGHKTGQGAGRRPMPAAGTVSVVDGSQRGSSWGLRPGDRPWK